MNNKTGGINKNAKIAQSLNRLLPNLNFKAYLNLFLCVGILKIHPSKLTSISPMLAENYTP
ncbi:MAG: hypothetical protein Q9M92_13165 [Enterobacterales bacterium]|nr:hypothetical protein [Enterobacterales bacterium]